MAARLEYLPNYQLYTLPFLGLSPRLTGDNVLLRELKVAINQITCPIQNGS